MNAETQKTNSDLQEIYQKFKIDLFNLTGRNDINSDLNNFSAPLLMNINDEYLSSSPKVLLIGQETCGWGDGSVMFSTLSRFLNEDIDSVNILMDTYDKFKFAEFAKNNTPFWRFYKQLHKKLEIAPYNLQTDLDRPYPKYIAWTNIFKFDYKRKALSQEQKNVFKSINLELLKKEIKIIKPDMILFVTGWKYDDFIKEFFTNYSFEKIETGYLARIGHEDFPFNTFRTFHPHTLQLRKKFDCVFDLINTNRKQQVQ
jgi:hypothetical protein